MDIIDVLTPPIIAQYRQSERTLWQCIELIMYDMQDINIYRVLLSSVTAALWLHIVYNMAFIDTN